MARRHRYFECPEERAVIITTIRSGGTIRDACAKLGCTPKTFYRYLESHPDFRLEMTDAQVEFRTELLEVQIAQAELTAKAERRESELKRVREAARAEVIAELGVEGDLIADVRRHLGDEDEGEDEGEGGVGDEAARRIPRLTLKAYIALAWRRSWTEGPGSVQWARLLQPFVAEMQRLELSKEIQDKNESEADRPPGQLDNSGVILFEVPHNPARRHLQQRPIVDAEVIGE